MRENWNCKEECRFCEIFNTERPLKTIDTPLMKNRNYIAIVSLGAFIEGWVLIIPREHIYSMKNRYCDNDFYQIVNNMLIKLKKVYKKECIIFEHGANHMGSKVACGTNHAHIHILPYNQSLLECMKKDGKQWIECESDKIADIVQDNEYWFYSENVKQAENLKGFLHIIKKPESQYFRKLLANREGIIGQYNYKEFSFLNIAENTYEKLKG